MRTALIPWTRSTVNPFWGFSDFEQDFDRLLTSFTNGTELASGMDFTPACDVIEGQNHYMFTLDIPGMKREDVKIEAVGNRLTVSGERHHSHSDEKQGSKHIERRYGKFRRVFTLPENVEMEKVEARYENGVLAIAVPKAERAKAKQIDIKEGHGGFFEKLLGSKKSEKEIKATTAA